MPGTVDGPTLIVKIEVVSPSGGGVTEFSLRAVVTPVGAPETERSTAWLKPFTDVTVTVELVESPSAIVREGGVAAREKSAAAVTVRLMIALWPCVALVALMVRGYVFEATDAPTFIVRFDVMEPSGGGVIEVGSKEALTPFGRPEIVRLTAELKPSRDVTFIVDVPELP